MKILETTAVKVIGEYEDWIDSDTVFEIEELPDEIDMSWIVEKYPDNIIKCSAEEHEKNPFDMSDTIYTTYWYDITGLNEYDIRNIEPVKTQKKYFCELCHEMLTMRYSTQ